MEDVDFYREFYRYGLIGRRIRKYGFICGQADEKGELYYLQTGKYTALIIEGAYEPHEEYDEEIYYDFYKQNNHPKYSKCDILGEHLDCEQILKRLEGYFKARERFLKEQKINGKMKGMKRI